MMNHEPTTWRMNMDELLIYVVYIFIYILFVYYVIRCSCRDSPHMHFH